jgi:hypothetical protein
MKRLKKNPNNDGMWRHLRWCGAVVGLGGGDAMILKSGEEKKKRITSPCGLLA